MIANMIAQTAILGAISLWSASYAAAIVPYREMSGVTARDGLTTSSACPQTQGANMTLFSGSETYIMNVPANQTSFDTTGPLSELGCLGPIGFKYSMCTSCDFPVNGIGVSEEARTCAIQFLDSEYALFVSHASSPLAITPPSQIRMVRCGLSDFDPPETRPPMVRDEASSDTIGRLASSKVAREEIEASVAGSADPNCPFSEPESAVVNTNDGQTYFVPVPDDFRAHWMIEMHCLRQADYACIPCSQIGGAVSLQTHINSAPCIFFTEDHRSFTLPYLWGDPNAESQLAPPVPVFPSNPISGIECGTD